MKNYFDVLRKCPLFNNIDDESLEKMLGCLRAKTSVIKKAVPYFPKEIKQGI